jgi:hypothetical protein
MKATLGWGFAALLLEIRAPVARSTRIGGGTERIHIAAPIFTQPIEPEALFDVVGAGLR